MEKLRAIAKEIWHDREGFDLSDEGLVLYTFMKRELEARDKKINALYYKHHE